LPFHVGRQTLNKEIYSMPIKELLALTLMILSGIYIAHPFDFQNEVRKVEISILKEASRTNDWGNPSFSGTKKYTQWKNPGGSNRIQSKNLPISTVGIQK
jgi:hypothetical protein